MIKFKTIPEIELFDSYKNSIGKQNFAKNFRQSENHHSQ